MFLIKLLSTFFRKYCHEHFPILFNVAQKYNFVVSVLKVHQMALAGVAQWTEHWPANQRVAGSIPSQGTCLGCGARSPIGVHKR